MRAVLDVNVLVSAILSPTGAPARLLLAWRTGAFELIVSPALLAELNRALEYPKLRRLVPAADADAYVDWLGVTGFNWGTAGQQSEWRPFSTVFEGLRNDGWTTMPAGLLMARISASSYRTSSATGSG